MNGARVFALRLVAAAVVAFAVMAGLSRLPLSGERELVAMAGGIPRASVLGDTVAAGEPPRDSWVSGDGDAVEVRVVERPPSGTTGSPYPGETVGLLTFRGNPTRSFYGQGPVPQSPSVQWTYPGGAMCGLSTVGSETTQWCGTGWTGQPAVRVTPERTWLVFGAYDKAIHFVDAHTGEDILPPFPTGDIIKGSVTLDPDGFPLVYSGSRDGRYRVIAVDGTEPRELWALTSDAATGPTRWNDDWDGAGLVVDDMLLEGGENSRFFAAKLNRAYGPDGLVTVAPEVLFDTAGWDDELLAGLPDGNVSIENSVAYHEGIAYFSNSGGLVQGWDLTALEEGGTPELAFRFWMGDDTDASVVVTDDGRLVVASEWERYNERSREVGQVAMLDPSDPVDPLVWSFHDPRAESGRIAGVWGTPALHGDTVIVGTTGGTLYGLDAADGEVRWEMELGDHLWSSPVVVDDTLIQGDCQGGLHAFGLDGAAAPVPLWEVTLNGCIESTPAVWDGRIFVGTRAGQVYAVAD